MLPQNKTVMEKSFNFSLEMIKPYKILLNEKEYVISKQLLRSSTSIGANINEAGAAFSKSDFIHKMSIASKEAREARYWLMLLDKSQIVEFNYKDYLFKVEELIKMLTAIVKTSQRNNKQAN
ncbi:MAG: four helix bundle protein [Bacteroidota bacterium]|jgi:four helix bundle protein